MFKVISKSKPIFNIRYQTTHLGKQPALLDHFWCFWDSLIYLLKFKMGFTNVSQLAVFSHELTSTMCVYFLLRPMCWPHNSSRTSKLVSSQLILLACAFYCKWGLGLVLVPKLPTTHFHCLKLLLLKARLLFIPVVLEMSLYHFF